MDHLNCLENVKAVEINSRKIAWFTLQFSKYVIDWNIIDKTCKATLISERNLARKDKHEAQESKPLNPQTERYTIFHALFEALKEKGNKKK